MTNIREEEIVEERIWRAGVEMVSRVNWSQIARVRRSLGVVADEGAGNSGFSRTVTQRAPSGFYRPAGGVAEVPSAARSVTGPRQAPVVLRIRQSVSGGDRIDTPTPGARRSA